MRERERERGREEERERLTCDFFFHNKITSPIRSVFLELTEGVTSLLTKYLKSTSLLIFWRFRSSSAELENDTMAFTASVNTMK